jgi:hypothetical protein
VESNGTAPGPSIFELMPRFLAAIRPVGKEGHNTQQNYRFRSVDGVYDAVHAAEATVGVFHMPEVLQRDVETLPTKSGGHLRLVTVKAVYRFYGPRGDHVVLGPVWGEGSDSGDKATAKAQTAAIKYGLIHALCIPLEGDVDADAHAVEFVPPSSAPDDPEQWFRDNGWADGKVAHDAYRADSVALRNSLGAETRADFRDWMEEHGLAFNRAHTRTEAEGIREQLEGLRDSETVVAPEDGQRVPVERPPDGTPLRREDLTPVPVPENDEPF